MKQQTYPVRYSLRVSQQRVACAICLQGLRQVVSPAIRAVVQQVPLVFGASSMRPAGRASGFGTAIVQVGQLRRVAEVLLMESVMASVPEPVR